MTTNPYDAVDYRLWSIFDAVENNILKDIVLLHIFGNGGQSALFVTKCDQVYALGVNVVGYLGIGEAEGTNIPLRLDLLCGKVVMGFSSGSTHSVAYTKEGELYSWGDNNLGKLGNGTIISRDSPGRVLLPNGVKVIQTACSDRYTVALTSEYKVLHWGDIEWNSGTSQTLPIYLEFPGDIRIRQLSCGALHAAALSSDGEVYTWGCGDMGQLGRSAGVQILPKLVGDELSGRRIQQVACSLVSTVVLTDDGRVFAWGHNSDGILGVTTAADIDAVYRPLQVHLDDTVKSISAANMGVVISAVSDSGVYKWGFKDPENYPWNSKFPYLCNVNHWLNVYAQSPTPRLERTFDIKTESGTLENDKNEKVSKEEARVFRDIGSTLYNNKEYSDLVLRLSDGVIYVHKLILRTFCEHFKSMLDGSWAENDEKEINLTNYNPVAYRAFVRYIYTGKLDQSLDGAQLIELCDIAESYFEDDLKRMVIAKFSTCLTIDNVSDLYSTAFSQPCEEIKEICCGFVCPRLEEVILTEGFDRLKGDLCKSLVKRSVQIKRNKLLPAFGCSNDSSATEFACT